jgi:hypothetical protein
MQDVLNAHKAAFFDKPFTENYRKYFFGNPEVKEKIRTRLQLSAYQLNERITGRTKTRPTENEAANSVLWPLVKELFIDFYNDVE